MVLSVVFLLSLLFVGLASHDVEVNDNNGEHGDGNADQAQEHGNNGESDGDDDGDRSCGSCEPRFPRGLGIPSRYSLVLFSPD